MQWIREVLRRLGTDNSGVTGIEYGLIAGIIAGVLLSAMAALSIQMSTTLSTISFYFPPQG